MAKGSRVSWATTLVAYVHAVSHVLREEIQGCGDENEDPNLEEKDPHYCFKWRGTVNWIREAVITTASILGEEHYSCIVASISKLRAIPVTAEYRMSAPAFLLQARLVTRGPDFPLEYATEYH